MEGIIKELMTEVHISERAANKEKYVGEANCILIHPKWFHQVAAFDKYQKYLEIDMENQHHRLCGYPLLITQDVDKWEIKFKLKE